MACSILLDAGRRFICTFVSLLAFGLPFAAQAQAIAVQNLAVLVDADGSETIASVSAPEAAQRFTPLDGLLSAGYTRKVHWLRFSVQAPVAGSWWLEVMPPFLDDLRLFTPDGAGFTERRSGDRLPFASREENYGGFIFKLALADSAQHTYYLRLQTTSASLLTLQLWQPERFRAAQEFENALMGFLLGVFMLLLLLNVLLWLNTREPLYGWFSLYVSATMLLYFAYTGLVAQHLLPQNPLIADASMGAFVLLFLSASVPFTRRMLHVGRDQKFFFAVFRVMVVLPCLLLASLVTGHYPEAARIALGVSGAGDLLMLYLSVQLWRQGRRESNYLMLAMAAGLLTSVGGTLFLMGLIPGSLFISIVQWHSWIPLLVALTLQAALLVRLGELNRAKVKEAMRTALAERDALHKLQVNQFELEAQNEELRRTRDELDTSKARHFDFYDVAPVGYCTVSEKGLIKEVNLTASTLFNVPRSQLIKQPIGNFIFNDDQGIYYQLRRKLKDTDKPLSCELRLLEQGGTPFWAHLDAMAAKDEEGAPVLRLVLTNVSEHKQLELEREEALTLLKKIADRVPGMVYKYHLRLDGSSYFPYASEAIREIYRVSPQQAFENAAAVFAVLHPDDHDAVVIAIQQSAADITPWLREYRVKFDDGTVRWLLGNALPQRQADGGTLWHGFITDITERKQMEMELARQTQLLHDVVDNLPFGLAVYDKKSHILLSNKNLAAVMDLPADFLDKPEVGIADLVRLNFERGSYPEQTLESVLQRFMAILQAGKAVKYDRHQSNGSWLEISSRPLGDGINFVTYEDVTQRKTSEQKLVLAMDLAETANLAKSRFLATMSHEIRTPMNAVLGMAQVLMQANIPEANRLDYARTIFNSGQTLLALLNDILDLSKIEAGKVNLESIALAPEQLIAETKALFDQSSRAKGLSIEAHWIGPDRRYLGDPNRLRRMLSNLIGNAIKFTKQGSIRIEASELACAGQSATLEFAVIDSGIGIAKDKQDLLFQTFSQADSSTTRNYGGTGLGLSIVRTLARAMGGEVGVQSEAGVGSRFWFRIQLGLLAVDALAVSSQVGLGITAGDAAQPRQLIGRVLVVEDNPINQEVMQALLGQMGLEVALADDGQQALDALMDGENAQLILTDLQMPVVDGYTAAQRIREWEAQTQQKRRPIIAFSADAYAGVRARCLAAGMDEVLSKPVLQGELWAALAKWLPAVALAPQSAPLALVLRTVDPEAVSALVNEILPMLAQGKVNALRRFKALQELVAGSELVPEMADAGLPLKEFRFDLTRQRLLQMASKYEWKTAP